MVAITIITSTVEVIQYNLFVYIKDSKIGAASLGIAVPKGAFFSIFLSFLEDFSKIDFHNHIVEKMA